MSDHLSDDLQAIQFRSFVVDHTGPVELPRDNQQLAWPQPQLHCTLEQHRNQCSIGAYVLGKKGRTSLVAYQYVYMIGVQFHWFFMHIKTVSSLPMRA